MKSKKPASAGGRLEGRVFLGGMARQAPVAVAVMAALSTARAQEVDTAQPGGGGLQEVVVTAEKRSESLQNVPITISALDSKALADKEIHSFSDYASQLPQVAFSNTQPGAAQVFMRGIGSSGGGPSGSEPTVGMYLDEQPITTITGAIDVHMYDIARVEVLPGPQGTLYGASSESGTLRVITNKPDPSGFKAGYDAQVNTVKNGTVGGVFEGFVNIPVTDHAAVRLVGWYERDSGYIDNVHQQISLPNSAHQSVLDNAALVEDHFNPVTTQGGRLAAKIDLGDNWTVSPTLMAQKTYWDGSFAQESWNESAAEGIQNPWTGDSLPAIGTPIRKDLAVATFAPTRGDDSWVDAALTVQGRIGNFDVTYATAYLHRDSHSSGEYTDYTLTYQQYTAYWPDNPAMLAQNIDHFKLWSNELRVASPSDWPVRFVAGAFYERQRHDFVNNQFIPGVSPQYWNGADTPNTWKETWWLTDEERVDRDYAVFGEMNWDITSRLTLTAGIRRFWYNNTLDGYFGFGSGVDNLPSFQGWAPGEVMCTGPAQPVLGAPCQNVNAATSGKGWTPKYNLSYKIDANHLIYATLSKGFRPGGINRIATVPSYGADFLKNYEVGWKTSWLDNHLRVNGALYYEQWQNFQFSFPGEFLTQTIANAGAVDVRGAELNVDWVPLSGLTLHLGGAYNNAKLTENYCGTFDANGSPISSNPCVNASGAVIAAQAPIGTRLPYTPLVKSNLSARYVFPFLGETAHVQVDEVYQTSVSPQMKPALAEALGEQGAYGLTNLFLGIDRDNWSVELLVKNAFDRRAALSRYAEAGSATGIVTFTNVAMPRLIGLQLSQKF